MFVRTSLGIYQACSGLIKRHHIFVPRCVKYVHNSVVSISPRLKWSTSLYVNNSPVTCCKRNCCNSSQSYVMGSKSSDDTWEIAIKIPNGVIAGKVWNATAPTAVICLHGWQDNAGTFDKLIPLLPKHLCFVAVDFMGHGLSSHRPIGCPHILLDHLLTIDRVVRYFKFKQVIIMGHSLGSGVALLYAGTRPELVHSVVSIDLIKSPHTPTEQQPERTRKALDSIQDAEEKVLRSKRPAYTYEEMVARTVKSHAGSLSEEGVKTLLKRGSKQLPDGTYSFTYDLQIRTLSLLSLSLEQQLAFADKIRCRVLMLKAKNGPYYEPKTVYDEAIDVYKRAAREFIFQIVDGTHHTHLETPEHVAPHIIDFLSPDKLQECHNNIFTTEEDRKRHGDTTLVLAAPCFIQSCL